MSKKAHTNADTPALASPMPNKAHKQNGAPSKGGNFGTVPIPGKNAKPVKAVYDRVDRPSPRIRYEIPGVAKFVAGVIVQCAMDYEEAVRRILGQRAEQADIATIAANIERDEQVQKCIQDELTIHGLDDASKEVYVQTLWDWFRHGSENKAMKAAGILGRGFIAEKVETQKPEELPIAGMGEVVKSMLGDSHGSDVSEPLGSTDDSAVLESAPQRTNHPPKP